MEESSNLLFKSEQINIPENDPFLNDKLNRKACSEALTNVVSNTNGPIVLSINGKWGTGKTTFLDMWEKNLKINGFTTMNFNAWKDDYCNNALIALIGQMWQHFKGSDWEEVALSVKECAASVFKSTIFNATKTMTAGIVDLNEENLKSISEKAIDEYLTAGENLNELKKRLKGFADKVQKESQKPIIIIIDELDRCRPTFAIELLEQVKHLFDIPGIIFVLGIDREQLGHSIRCVYGLDMDVNGYLERFIDMEFVIPQSDPAIFCKHIFEQLKLNDFLEKRAQSYHMFDDRTTINNTSTELCKCFELTLRNIEHYSRLFSLACLNTEKNHYMRPALLCILIILKLHNTELYRRFVSGNCNSEKVIEYILQQPKGEAFLNTRVGLIIEVYLFMASPEKWRNSVLNQLQTLYNKEKLLQPECLPKRILEMDERRIGNLLQACTDINSRLDAEITNETLGFLSTKIEMASLMLRYVD